MESCFVSNNFIFTYLSLHTCIPSKYIYTYIHFYLRISGILMFLILFDGFLVVWGLYKFLQPWSGSPRVGTAVKACFLLAVPPGDTNFSLWTAGRDWMTNLAWMPNFICHYGMCRMTNILCRNHWIISNLTMKKFCSLAPIMFSNQPDLPVYWCELQENISPRYFPYKFKFRQINTPNAISCHQNWYIFK